MSTKRKPRTPEQAAVEYEARNRRYANLSPEQKREFNDKRNIYQRKRYARPEVRSRLNDRSKAVYATPEGKRANKNARLKLQFGITLEDFEELLKIQGYRCAICASPEPGGIGTFHVDHDHETGNVRGLLCSNCNLMLGHAQDDAWILTRAIAYLEDARLVASFEETADRMLAEYLAEKAK